MYSPKFLNSQLYKKYAKQSLATFTAGDIYTDLQSIQACGVDELEAFDFLHKLLQALSMDSSGRRTVAEQNSNAISNTNTASSYWGQSGETFGGILGGSTSISQHAMHRLNIIDLTSNAGGNLDTDENIVAAKSGYYGCFKVIGIWSNAAETPTWVINGNATLLSLTTPAHVAGAVARDNQDLFIKGDADNQAIYLDTTSANLGNVKEYKWFIEYWWET